MTMLGLLSLVKSPIGMIAGAAMLCLGCFSLGVVKGFSWSQADQARAYARELEKAAIARDEISREDAAQAERDRAESVRVEATLEAALHEFKKAVPATDCRLSESELRKLRQLAAARR
jgi:Asp-tRNA(Asn)/Glu-tRNA(Gln) amidotransferase A subunit family amidase